MMKHVIFVGAFLLLNASVGEAIADCTNVGSWNRVPNIIDRVSGLGALGYTFCSLAGQGTQEEHHADGELWDYKLGDGHPVDPRVKVGTWTVSNNATQNATITYNYIDGGSSGPYSLWRDTGPNFDFCDANGNSVGMFIRKNTTGTSRVCDP